MKKILYSLMALGLFMTSCTDFDDPVVESYAAGPDVAITLDETGDDFIKFTVTPGEGTAFYSVLVDESATAAAVDSVALYKAQYSGTVSVDAEKHPTYTYTIEAIPNTTYQIYAVAGSDKGIVGSVAVKAVTTSDSAAPQLVDNQYDAENKAMLLLFSEPVTRGEGAITVQVYKSKDIMNPVTLAAEEVQVLQLDATTVAILAPTTAPGAYLTFSYAEGAFVDALNNGCEAITSGLNMQTGSFVGLAGRNTVVPFAITEANVTEPVVGGAFGDWTQFMGVITLDFDLYTSSTINAGDLTVVYSNDLSEKSVKLTSENWAVEGNTLLFILPEEPAFGDKVGLKIAAGVITDVYGNGNEEVYFEQAWLRSYGFKRADFLGDYVIAYQSYFDGVVSQEAVNFAADEASETGVVISNMFAEGTKLAAEFNGDFGTLTIPVGQLLGTYTFTVDADGNTADYAVYFMEGGGKDAAVFNLAADGSFTSSDLWGYYLVDAASGSELGWYDVAAVTQGAKAPAAATASKRALKVNKAALTKSKVLKK